MSPIIAYLRVSTQRQGKSGLGLEAQKAATEGFARANGRVVAQTIVEVESGKHCDRPQLVKALTKCKLLGATLVVAKLDRLARDLVFVATMLRDGVDFVACDAPYANRLTLGILAAVAEDEGRRISERTKAALAAARARGVKLGGFKGRCPTPEERRAGAAVRARQARERAVTLMPTIDEIRAAGVTSLAGIAEQLNAKGVPAAKGGHWRAAQVWRVVRAAM
jgi:DNA invertase Pin-like site-specific DNA recombinase